MRLCVVTVARVDAFRSQEDPKHTLYFAHVFFADHILSTAWTVYFAVVWWIYTPHDGRQDITSTAQKEIMEAGGGVRNMTEAERTAAATALWDQEKGTAAAVITLGWISKVCHHAYTRRVVC